MTEEVEECEEPEDDSRAMVGLFLDALVMDLMILSVGFVMGFLCGWLA